MYHSGQNRLSSKIQACQNSDAALGAFSVFFTQCPSFLAHQKHLQETKDRIMQ